MGMTILSNHHRLMLHTWHEIGDVAVQETFEYVYVSDDTDTPRFVQYKGEWYDVFEFEVAPEALSDWDGYISTYYFSGILVKFLHGDDEGFVQMGRYYT